MNDIPNRKQVDAIKTRYPPGNRVRVDSVEDPYTNIPSSTEGTVFDVDCVGTIHCKFDPAQSLGLIPSVDSFQKIGDAPMVQRTLRHKQGHGR